MTIDFQTNLLKYFVQMKESRKFIFEVDSNLFDLDEHKFIFSAIQTYVTKFHYIPSKVNFLEYLDSVRKEFSVPEKTMNEFKLIVGVIFDPLDSDIEIYKTVIIEFIQKKRSKDFIEKNLDKLLGGENPEFGTWAREFQSISDLSKKQASDNDSGSFLLKDFGDHIIKANEATPIYLKLVNRMTSDRGFYSPQLVILMSGPKGFKTGSVINIVKHLVKEGKKVFFADFENSHTSIHLRMYQSILECEKHELYLTENQTLLKKLVQGYSQRGGDLRTEYFPAHVTTLDAIENKLDELKESYAWEPDVIIYDYLDLAGCADRIIREKRLQIQYNYHHAIRINNQRKTFAFTLSQISKEAQEKMEKHRYINMKDFSEDFGKAMNCHAAFAMCRNSQDLDNNLGFIIPVAQREGLRYKLGIECPVYIDEARQMMVEDTDYMETFLKCLKGNNNE